MTSRVERRAGARTLVYAGDAVFEHHQLVDLSELLEHRTQVVLVEVARYLADEQLDGVRVLVGGCQRAGGGGRRRVVGRGDGERLRRVMRGDRRALLDVQHVEGLVRRGVGHLDVDCEEEEEAAADCRARLVGQVIIGDGRNLSVVVVVVVVAKGTSPVAVTAAATDGSACCCCCCCWQSSAVRSAASDEVRRRSERSRRACPRTRQPSCFQHRRVTQ